MLFFSAIVMTSMSRVCCSTSREVVAAWYAAGFFIWKAANEKSVQTLKIETMDKLYSSKLA